MKNSMWVIIIIVVGILGFIVGYSLAPRNIDTSAQQSVTSGGYGGGHGAAGGYGGASSGGYGGGQGAAGGYGGASSGGYGGAPSGGYGGH
ncbi:MAG: hypothetical protein AMK70_03745 [Nitrospira bacterium SG8_35_1]|nr:MAG: hypothetical protein AMK70_03745 [Nitrospira bacterium SG8_35_1]